MVNQPMSSSLRMTDFYPTAEPAEAEETPPKVTQNSQATQKKQQNTTPHKQTVIERRQKLIDGIIKGKTISQLAKELNVDRCTLYRDFDVWIQTEESQYLHQEWIHLYQKLKQDNPEKAFDGLTKLLGMKQKKAPEVNVNLNQTIDVTAATDALIQFSRKNTATTDEQK